MKKKLLIIQIFFLLTMNLFAQNLLKKESNSGNFYFYIPKDWEDVSKYNDLCLDSFAYQISESSFFTITSIDMYSLYKDTPQFKNTTRSQFSYKLYSKSVMDETLENWVVGYLYTLRNTHPDLKVLEKKIEFIDHQPSIYLKITYGYDDETIIQEIYDLMYMGIDTKFTYFYNTQTDIKYLPVFQALIKSVKY